MAYKVLYSEDALADLEAILDYIRADNPKAAERFGTALLNHIDLLQEIPLYRQSGSWARRRSSANQHANLDLLSC